MVRMMKRACLPVALAVSMLLAGVSPAFAQAEEAVFQVSGFSVSGATLVEDAELQDATRPYVGAGRTFAHIEQARAAVQALYVARGYGAVQVVVPEQEVTGGVVRLQVVEARLARVEVSGNQHFGTDNVRRSLPQLVEGVSPNTRALSRSLALANESPARQSVVTLGAGEKSGEIVARVAVRDEKPWRITLGLDNTGNGQTGRSRASVTYRHANLFDRDHQFMAQYITSPGNPGDVSIAGLAYRVPFYRLGDSLQVVLSRSNVSSGSVAGFDLTGRGTSAGLRYFRNLDAQGAWQHHLFAGLDRRAYRSGLRAPGVIALRTDLGVRPLSIGYGGVWRTQTNQLGLNLTLVRNLAGGTHGSQRDFDANRVGAKADYTLFRYGAWWRHVFANQWSATLSVNGQETGDVLTPVEFFGLGGAESVRGFYEREVGGDVGSRVGFEVHTPDLAPRLGLAKSGLRFLWFVDAGYVKRKNVLPGELRSVNLASTGLGMRYSFARTGSLRVDAARVLDGDGVRSDGSHRIHASLVWSF